MKAFMNWSGGKDSSLALYHILKDKSIETNLLFTNVNSAHNRVSMHGLRRDLLLAQSRSIGLPLYTAELPEAPSMTDYEEEMNKQVGILKERGYTKAVYGDIFLEDLKKYREEQMTALGMKCIFPLWKKDTRELMQEFLDLGFKAIVICVNGAFLDPSFCGRIIDQSFVDDLPAGVDPCGENGEYHSFVFDGPIFSHPVLFQGGDIVTRSYPAPKDEKNNCFATAAPNNEFYFKDLLSI
jgi:uncharacterized protein (TIGR00290 family)